MQGINNAVTIQETGQSAGFFTPEEIAQQRAAQIDRLNAFGESLQKKFDQRVAEKNQLETRWLANMRQYNGEYDAETLAAIQSKKGSQAFVNLTRMKCNAAEARMCDMLLPTDDRNWDIRPTPDPDLGTDDSATDQTPITTRDGQPLTVNGQQITPAQVMADEHKRAADMALAMRNVMDDQLTECNYNLEVRKSIHDLVVLGSAIIKGPAVINRTKRRWHKKQYGELTVHEIAVEESLDPVYKRVSPWDFFPDRSVSDVRDCSDIFERHRVSRKQLREYSKHGLGFLSEQINLVLADKVPSAMSGLVGQAGDEEQINQPNTLYEVIEYHGVIDKEDLKSAGAEVDTDDNLTEHSGIVWFCGGLVIKAVLNPMDCGDYPYSVMPWDRDDNDIFGRGIPDAMADSQRVVNAAWRMVLDNAAFSVLPQTVVDRSQIEPANGDWQITPGKLWFKTSSPQTPLQAVFAQMPITSNLGELVQIFNLARGLIDDETGIPLIAQGEQAPHITKTAQGMTLLMNSANTILRRLVREFDEGITKPNLTRLYHWNMQFNEDESIKGDYDIVPLGSSALMVKEQQTQEILNLIQLASSNPIIGQKTDFDQLYTRLLQSMNINAEGVLLSEEQIKTRQQQQPSGPSPQQQVAEADLQVKQAQVQVEQQKVALQDKEMQINASLKQQEIQSKERIAQMEYSSRMAQIQASQHIETEKVKADAGIAVLHVNADNQRFNTETALKAEYGSGI